jgi:hypothetical protein
MPVEFRFDDLDLREEPESAKSDKFEGDASVRSCADTCTQTCTTSHNTCTTFYC